MSNIEQTLSIIKPDAVERNLEGEIKEMFKSNGFQIFKEKKIFTGDTLFSVGCGRIFEGTYEQMYNSLKRIKSLPTDTEIYCGHEYTLQNSNFCIANDSGNLKLKNKILEINKKLKNALPTIPSTLADELECNIFLKAKDLESFSKLRDLKDNF